MTKCILVLEDNPDRRDAMREWLDDRLPMYELVLTDDPAEFIDHLRERPERVLAASLDHDLHERADMSTALTGMIVADYLAGIEPAFPVLLHTSNRPDGERMLGRLSGAGWKVTWVRPFDGTSWVGEDWYPALRRALRGAARREAVAPGDDRD